MNSSPRPVRTRFAPSPTGYMHIGGMRTALFNWLWARHNNGTFILRIDDTDEQRNLDAALGPILRAFKWLGLNWDEGPEVGGPFEPYFQSERKSLYHTAIEKLIAEGKAYYCFDTPEQLAAERAAAEKEKRQFLNSRRSLELSELERNKRIAQGDPHVIRFLTPRDLTVKLDDAIRGHVEWDCSLMPDPVIMRGNGSPLYNFASVIDDAQMQISHVIRAEEHLSNTPIQVLLHQALGNELPIFAHIPYVAAPGSKEKLSKRKLEQYRKNPQFKKMFERADDVFPKIGLENAGGLDPVMVEYYEKIGYLPQGVLNALARIGWSLDDKTEIMSLDEIVKNFTLDRVVKSPAGLDPDKLNSFQAHWMMQLPVDEKLTGCLPFLIAAKYIPPEPNDKTKETVRQVIEALGDRLKLFSDVLDYDEFFCADDQLKYDEKAFEKRLKAEGAAELVREFATQLETAEPFDAPTLDALLHRFVDEKQLKIGEIIHALRVAVTGKPQGIGMFECLAFLGRERCLNRIRHSLARLEK
ncbi:MAG: glutamate--tRNA ligase [Planctomycetota bacterium]|nr:glutamate--tRNA ligase [Planctomycetota bacterium]